jgi:hypothetical protein
VPVSVAAGASGKRKSGAKLLWGALGVLVLGVLVVVGTHSKGWGIDLGVGDSAVDTVRNGVLGHYNTTTVGKAFEGTFQDPKWKSFVSAKGTTIVEFNGTVKPKTLLTNGLYIPESSSDANTPIIRCIDALNLQDEMRQEAGDDSWRFKPVYFMLHASSETFDKLNECVILRVTFQFALSADKETFSMAYIDEKFSNQAEKVMDFIYH